jgi:hypothetical protein
LGAAGFGSGLAAATGSAGRDSVFTVLPDGAAAALEAVGAGEGAGAVAAGVAATAVSARASRVMTSALTSLRTFTACRRPASASARSA